MPVVETTLISGYDADTKARLMKGMTRVVRSVMAAPPEAVITVIKEVAPTSYARGGVSRVPGPPLPPATEVATAFAEALAKGDADAVEKLATANFKAHDTERHTLTLAQTVERAGSGRKKSYDSFVEALTDDGSLVFAEGIYPEEGKRFIDRFRVTGAFVAEMVSW